MAGTAIQFPFISYIQTLQEPPRTKIINKTNKNQNYFGWKNMFFFIWFLSLALPGLTMHMSMTTVTNRILLKGIVDKIWLGAKEIILLNFGHRPQFERSVWGLRSVGSWVQTPQGEKMIFFQGSYWTIRALEVIFMTRRKQSYNF